MKKVMFYCQHVLGMGHFVRSMELVKGLKDFQVCFLNGGEVIPGFPLPPEVEVVQLPALKSDADFKEIRGTDESQNLDTIKRQRVACLLEAYERFKPDVLIIELFPFGRKQFAFELIPLLARIRLAGAKTKVVCSLRDILVSRKDQEHHERRVCTILNRYFDAVLIHADPRLQRLEETFASVGQLKSAIEYTGYVVEKSTGPGGDFNEDEIPLDGANEALILVSIGGGRVGYELLASAIEASAIVARTQRHHMLVFTGPYLPEDEFAALKRLSQNKPNITLRRYTSHFVSYMEKASLSVSMAGYNTCMNVLTTGVPALVLPFGGGGNDEQTIRAKKLAALGLVGMIDPRELQPHLLAEKIIQRLNAEAGQTTLGLSGVENSAAFIGRLVGRQEASPKATSQSAFNIFEKPLQSVLDQLQAQKKVVRVFLRDDDVDQDEESLRQLLDISFARGVAINLEIIPAALTDAAAGLLSDYKGFQPSLIGLHQHGWQHVNHESAGKKCEFGASRSFAMQLSDIAQGKARLEQAFEDKFFAAFTPPWNRCSDDTLTVLDQLGFRVLSCDHYQPSSNGYGFRQIPVSLDLFRWQGGAALRPAAEIVENLTEQLLTANLVGLMLHHKVMDGAAFSLVDFLLRQLRRSPNVEFHGFESLPPQVNQGLTDHGEA